MVTTNDYPQTLAFYRDTLGLAELESYTVWGGHVTILDAGRATLEINDPIYAEYIDEVESDPGSVGTSASPSLSRTSPMRPSGPPRREPSSSHPRLRHPWNSLNARLEAPAGLQLTLFTDL